MKLSPVRPLASMLLVLAVGCSKPGAPGEPPAAAGSGGRPVMPAPPQPDATAPATPDVAPPVVVPDAAPEVPSPADVPVEVAVEAAAPEVADTASDAAGDGGASAPLGMRVSLEEMVTARWVGDRRTVAMDGATKIFTGAYRPGQFGGSGDGHIIRFKIPPGKEYIFEYRFRFNDGFDFSRGGKIPGLGGGNAPSGCATSTGVGFSARSMWRQQGRLIGYIYDMDQRTDCGNAIETGFNFGVGKWYAVKQRIKLNTGRNRDGILELAIDGRTVINRSNMGWMIEAADRRIDRVFLDFFFGGSTADWAPSRPCSISFADLHVTRLAE